MASGGGFQLPSPQIVQDDVANIVPSVEARIAGSYCLDSSRMNVAHTLSTAHAKGISQLSQHRTPVLHRRESSAAAQAEWRDITFSNRRLLSASSSTRSASAPFASLSAELAVAALPAPPLSTASAGPPMCSSRCRIPRASGESSAAPAAPLASAASDAFPPFTAIASDAAARAFSSPAVGGCSAESETR
eukprot:CAMPEP_0182824100 /NCGR_PEP_ID=MMETSP0006_2-20121128/15110_1 /TAXON_ID=97485 /ORGANISM="Prymnesium parvum, Strain Texoma1" /LENGTH=189 /DNA_ID=CAMNT_0024951075 /DNA_START=136 /DNA_END=702 /DNA_ORIENTATION=-